MRPESSQNSYLLALARYLTVFMFALSACAQEEQVYVPGPNFHQKIKLTLSKYEVVTDERVRIFVSRQTDGWIKKKISDVDTKNPETCWFRGKPAKFEKEVSANVAFNITPHGFDQPNTGESALLGRSVVFTKAGIYKIVGFSALWCSPGPISNEIQITVR